MTDAEVVSTFGQRLRAVRLARNIGAVELETRTGLSRNTILNAERGANPRLSTVVKILRALGRLQALDGFLPDPPVSPIALLERAGKPRLRARRVRRG